MVLASGAHFECIAIVFIEDVPFACPGHVSVHSQESGGCGGGSCGAGGCGTLRAVSSKAVAAGNGGVMAHTRRITVFGQGAK